jgi:hypothetical protein
VELQRQAGGGEQQEGDDHQHVGPDLARGSGAPTGRRLLDVDGELAARACPTSAALQPEQGVQVKKPKSAEEQERHRHQVQ